MVFDKEQYELLDFGHGRKLEQFGGTIVDRPSPSATDAERASPALWKRATARFERGTNQGKWQWNTPRPAEWHLRHLQTVLELAPSPVGHLGVFPEQAVNWDWIEHQVGAANQRLSVMNLFGYTGGSTLAAASAGADVVHVDAARNTVGRARKNAALSGLEQYPIRWLVEDVRRFCDREIKRGHQYDGLILDPPTFGHGPKNERWEIVTHLKPLLDSCRRLLSPRCQFVLLTSHTEQFSERDLAQSLEATCSATRDGTIEAGEMFLTARDGRQLGSGRFARWSALQEQPG